MTLMKKYCCFKLLFGLIILFFILISSHPQKIQGNTTIAAGTAANPYQIKTAAQLSAIQENPGAHYILMNDITLEGQWTPIGRKDEKYVAFSGHFDGNGKKIINLHCIQEDNQSNQFWVGLFASMENATVRNLQIENAEISGYRHIGALVGRRLLHN